MGEEINFFIAEKLKINKRALWNRLSELTRIAEYFFVNENLTRNDLTRKSIFIEELASRNLLEQIRLESTYALKTAHQSPLNDDSLFYKQKIYAELSSYYTINEDQDRSSEYYNIMSDNIMVHFVTSLIKQLLDSELRKRNNISEDVNAAEKIINALINDNELVKLKEKNKNIFIPAEIYYDLYLAFKDPKNYGNYFSAKEIFLKNKSLFSFDFKNSVYQYLRNYCIDMTNIGEAKYYEEIFNINRSIIEEGLFSDFNAVNTGTNNFRNFIFAALRLNEYKWVKSFIDKYSSELPDEIRDDEVNLNNGILKIYEKEYSAALQYLKKVNRKRYLHYLDTSVYKLIVFYETDEFEDSYLETARLKDYLRKHKEIPSYLRTGYQKFIKLFELLLKLNQKYDITENELFIVQMEPIKTVGLGSWLYEKGIELLNKKAR
jgi:hypothetical protein